MSLRRYVLLSALACFAVAPALAQSVPNAAELHSFVLTDSGVAHYTAAMHAIFAYEQAHPEDSKGDKDGADLDTEAANISRHPAKAAILAKNDISARDFVKTMTVMMSATVFAGAGGNTSHLPDFLSAANVDWVRAHPAQAKSAMTFGQ